MTWSTLFRDFIQPVLFAGLFAMTFISLLVVLRNERREAKKHKKKIVPHPHAVDPLHMPPTGRIGGIGNPQGRKSEDWFSIFN